MLHIVWLIWSSVCAATPRVCRAHFVTSHALQYKELEVELKSLKEQREAAQRAADQQGESILQLEGNWTAAEEQRRICRKQLAEVG